MGGTAGSRAALLLAGRGEPGTGAALCTGFAGAAAGREGRAALCRTPLRAIEMALNATG